MAASHLADKPALAYVGNDKEIVRQAVIFVLRGMGMKEEVIAQKYDPKALDRETGTARNDAG